VLELALVDGGCRWVANTPLALYLRESENLFSIIETTHVLGIIGTAGIVTIIDLRLLGVLLPGSAMPDVLRPLGRFAWYGFTVMLISGLLLFCAEAADLCRNRAFALKMALLVALGLNQWIFQAIVYRGIAAQDAPLPTRRRARFSAVLSLILWLGVVVLGRAIAYA
jgi:hypothetical protein